MRNILTLAISFLVLIGVLFYLLSAAKNRDIQEYLNSVTKQSELNYQVLYLAKKRLAEMVFKTRLNRDKVIDIFEKASSLEASEKNRAREELHSELGHTYELLKEYNIKQLHFHLPNNESFLRFHRPQIYGDNLSKVRPTVVYVNKNHTKIDGFEEGRIYNGYRFVFPMFKKEKYIGSVEVSFSTLAMGVEFTNGYEVSSDFLILKSLVQEKVFDDEKSNYVNSGFKNFVLEKEMISELTEKIKKEVKEPFSKNTLARVNRLEDDFKSFSLFDKNEDLVLTFLKVQNPINGKVVGIFFIRSNASYIFAKNRDFYLMFGVLSLLLITLFVYLYKKGSYTRKILKVNEMLHRSKQEILAFNNTLTRRVEKEVEKNREKEKQMLQQSRLAQMGEMISMIAHQWRQPLGAISSTSIDMKLKIDLDIFDLDTKESKIECQNYFLESCKTIENLTQNLTTTIDDFRDFYKTSKLAEELSINLLISKALNIIKGALNAGSITLREELNSKKEIEMFDSEIMQVLLNIFKNAQDNFSLKNITNASLVVTTQDTQDGVVVKIYDNGGGIPPSIMGDIFNPYFSTKEDKNGTGLGLYMSKLIVQEHHIGSLNAENVEDGVCFTMEIKGVFKKDV